MNVEQLMQRPVVTCRPEESLASAASKMWNYDIGCVPVVDESNHVVGMVTDRDVCMAAFLQDRPLGELRVDSAMARVVHSTVPTDRIEDVEVVMRRHKVRRVPVVDAEGRLVGVISVNDIARVTAADLRRMPPDGADGELVSTLACICQSRRAAPPPLDLE